MVELVVAEISKVDLEQIDDPRAEQL